MLKKAFITGISGFAGNHLARHLLQSGNYTVCGTYYSESSLSIFSDIKEHVTFIKADLTEAKKTKEIIAEQKPDLVFHLAALTSPAESFKDPTKTIINNVTIQINLLEAIKEYELFNTRVLIVSSADVYGIVSSNDLPIDEQTPFRPTNPYAVSKITQDYLGLQYEIAYKIPIIRVRPFNHIGPGQSPQFVVSSFAKQIAEIEKKQREPILYVGNLETKRDFTDVRDIVAAYSLVLEKGEKGEVYNVGSGKAHKISDIVEMLLGISTTKIAVKIDEKLLRPSDTPELLCDNKKLVTQTGWKPTYSIKDTVTSILDYWREMV